MISSIRSRFSKSVHFRQPLQIHINTCLLISSTMQNMTKEFIESIMEQFFHDVAQDLEQIEKLDPRISEYTNNGYFVFLIKCSAELKGELVSLIIQDSPQFFNRFQKCYFLILRVSKFVFLFTRLFRIVSGTEMPTDAIITFVFHKSFNSLVRSK